MSLPVPEGAPPIHHHWVAQPGDAQRLAGALTRASLKELVRPAVLFAIIAAALAVGSWFSGKDYLIYGAVGLIATAVLMPWIIVRKARAHFARIAFPGARWAIGYGPTSLVTYQPTASAVVSYNQFSEVRPGHANTVLLRYAHSRLLIVLPDALCPPPARLFLSEAIARSRGAPR